MTYTPGSWKAYPADTASTPHFGHLASDIWGINELADTAIVARVYHAETSSQANENLILAAPDLLAALKALVESIENLNFGVIDDGVVTHDVSLLQIPWAQADAAIDKATGQKEIA